MSQIGWGATLSGEPKTGGYDVLNTGSSDDYAQDAVCGVVGAFGAAVYSHEWIPATPGAESAVNDAYTDAGGAYHIAIKQPRNGGTIRVSAIVDGTAAETTCVLNVAYSNWFVSPAVYAGFSWLTEGVAPTDFWTLFVGTEEV